MLLKITDFGPIVHSLIGFQKVTVFIGPQGSGKSTVAKLYSLFMWLEKRLIRGLTTIAQIKRNSYFRTKLCGYHGLNSFFRDSSEIFFEGQHYTFDYKNGQISIDKKNQTENLEVYKVMYVPSDRNALSSLDDLIGIKHIPEYLKSFRDELNMAKKSLKEYLLPINDVQFEYNNNTKKSFLKGPGYKVNLMEASSGFQAVVPLLLVSEYLTRFVSEHKKENREHGLSLEEFEKLQKEVSSVINNKKLSEEVKAEALSVISSKYGYSGFVNIVEEPEQNLYPISQREVLYELLRLNNRQPTNKLVITTHSPYIIDYLTLAIKSGEILRKGAKPENIKAILPLESSVDSFDINIYHLENGRSQLLEMPAGIPSDSNSLNELLGETNKTFEELLDIEDSIL